MASWVLRRPQEDGSGDTGSRTQVLPPVQVCQPWAQKGLAESVRGRKEGRAPAWETEVRTKCCPGPREPQAATRAMTWPWAAGGCQELETSKVTVPPGRDKCWAQGIAGNVCVPKLVGDPRLPMGQIVTLSQHRHLHGGPLEATRSRHRCC